MDPVQPAGTRPLGDPVRPEAEVEQLHQADHAVLPRRERRQPHIEGGWGVFSTHLGR
jgi:hypothetical protein